MDSNGQNISWDLVVEGLSNMLFLSIFFVLWPQWANGHGFVKPRPRRSYHHSSECFLRPPMACQPETHQVVSFMDVTHIKYHWISMIYWWYPDVSVINFDEIWREITEIQPIWIDFCRCQRWKLRSPGYPLPRRKARGKPRLHRLRRGHRDLFGTQWWHQVCSLSTWICLDCLEMTVKTCKNPNLMVYHVFSLIDRYLEGIPYFHTQLNGWWFMNCFKCFTMFHMCHGGSLI